MNDLFQLGAAALHVVTGDKGYIVGRSQTLSDAPMYKFLSRTSEGKRESEWYPQHEIELLPMGETPPFLLSQTTTVGA